MAAANNEFFEALSMLEHERGITAEYLIDKIKAAIVIAVKKNYEVEDNNVMVEIDPANGKFNVALIQDVVADEDWYDEHSEIGITEAQNIRKDYQVGDRVVTPLKTKDFGRIAAQTAKHVIRQGIRARSSPAPMTSCRPPSPAWTPKRASWPWIWVRAARPFCPATSRCPVRLTPRARCCRSTLWTSSAATAARAL